MFHRDILIKRDTKQRLTGLRFDTLDLAIGQNEGNDGHGRRVLKETQSGQGLWYDYGMSNRSFTLSHALRVIFAIGWSDFVLKYRGSFLGYLWSLIGPLVKFGVILVVFGPYVQGQIPYYRLYLFLGIIIWEHFTVTTTACISMLHEKAAIIQRLPFPRVLLIFSVGWTNLVVFCTHMIVFGFLCVWLGLFPTVNATYIVITMTEMTLLALGIGMMLSAYSLRYRDIPHLWTMLQQILFWLTPIMYPPAQTGGPALSGAITMLSGAKIASFGGLLHFFIDTQPLSIIIHDARRTILYPALWGVPVLSHTMATLLICGTIFLLGLAVFLRRQGSFLQEY